MDSNFNLEIDIYFIINTIKILIFIFILKIYETRNLVNVWVLNAYFKQILMQISAHAY